MKTRLLIYFCSTAMALSAFGQSPSPTPNASATASPSATISATPADEDSDIARAVRKKVKRHIGVTVNPTNDSDFFNGNSDAAWMVVPLVGVIFTTVFGTPVLIVAAIMFFSYLKSRSLHRTVREMVAKGQPVPPELFAAPGSRIRTKSDLRRGVILVTIGVGLMIFFGGVSDWERGGPWVLGVIPLLIGVAYLALGRLETTKRENNTLRDNPPPLS